MFYISETNNTGFCTKRVFVKATHVYQPYHNVVVRTNITKIILSIWSFGCAFCQLGKVIRMVILNRYEELQNITLIYWISLYVAQ